MTFYIQIVKGQLHTDIIMFCKKTLFWPLLNVITQEQKGRMQNLKSSQILNW